MKKTSTRKSKIFKYLQKSDSNISCKIRQSPNHEHTKLHACHEAAKCPLERAGARHLRREAPAPPQKHTGIDPTPL